jgi:acyl carrier protein
VGLDSVELVLAVEEEFGITIDDADAISLNTPRVVADYVASRLGTLSIDNGRCLSQAAFYRIRSVLVRQFGAMRQDVRPASPIDHFLKDNRRQQWHKLASSIEATQLPQLRCRKSMYYPLTLGMPLVVVALMLYGNFSTGMVLVVFLLLWFATNIAAHRMADMLPSNVQTIGDLVPYVRPPKREDWTPDYVLQRVIQITAAQLEIPLEKIHPDHHFVKDLGLDS